MVKFYFLLVFTDQQVLIFNEAEYITFLRITEKLTILLSFWFIWTDRKNLKL